MFFPSSRADSWVTINYPLSVNIILLLWWNKFKLEFRVLSLFELMGLGKVFFRKTIPLCTCNFSIKSISPNGYKLYWSQKKTIRDPSEKSRNLATILVKTRRGGVLVLNYFVNRKVVLIWQLEGLVFEKN